VQAKFNKEQVILDGDVTSYTRLCDSGNQVQYEFCPACGTTMRLLLSDATDFVVVPVGLFNNNEFPQPTISIYEQRKHGWVHFECTMEHIE
jgi:hypothetical protein